MQCLLIQEVTDTADDTWVLFDDRWISLGPRIFVDVVEMEREGYTLFEMRGQNQGRRYCFRCRRQLRIVLNPAERDTERRHMVSPRFCCHQRWWYRWGCVMDRAGTLLSAGMQGDSDEEPVVFWTRPPFGGIHVFVS